MFLDILLLKTKTNLSLDTTVHIIWSLIFEQVAVNVILKTLNIAKKKYQKHEIVNNLWRFQRPQKCILSNVWGHFLTIHFSFTFIFVSVTRPLEVSQHE